MKKFSLLSILFLLSAFSLTSCSSSDDDFEYTPFVGKSFETLKLTFPEKYGDIYGDVSTTKGLSFAEDGKSCNINNKMIFVGLDKKYNIVTITVFSSLICSWELSDEGVVLSNPKRFVDLSYFTVDSKKNDETVLVGINFNIPEDLTKVEVKKYTSKDDEEIEEEVFIEDITNPSSMFYKIVYKNIVKLRDDNLVRFNDDFQSLRFWDRKYKIKEDKKD